MAAPKGNTNALKHGLYAKHYSPEEQAGLRKMTPEDYLHEIYLMRVAVKNMFEIHSAMKKEVERMMNSGQPVDVDGLTKITNSLALVVTALNTTARTHAMFSGTDRKLEDDYDKGLDSVTIFLEDKYWREEKEEDEEILVEIGKD